jgi:hypothetical protein
MAFNYKIVIPFLLAPLIGVPIGMQLFERIENENAPRIKAAAADPARAPSGASGPAQEKNEGGASGFTFADLMQAMRTGGAAMPAGEPEAAFHAALRNMAQEPATDDRIRKLQAIYNRWVRDNPAQALSQLESIRADERQEIVANALAMLAREQPDKFQAYIDSIGHDANTVLAATLGAIAEKAPQDALTWLQQNPGRDPQGELIAAVLPNLIRDDLPLAAKTVAGMEAQAPIALIQQVAVAYAQQDPAQAYAWVGNVLQHTDKSPSQVLNEVSASLVADNPNGAAGYLNRISDPVVRQSLMGELAMQKAQDDLPTAWNWLSQYSTDEHYGDTALNLLYRWSYARPKEVAAVLPSIADGEMQLAAATHLARFWQQRDRAGYQSWVASLPAGAMRDAAMSAQ